jgi:hypothetical protein
VIKVGSNLEYIGKVSNYLQKSIVYLDKIDKRSIPLNDIKDYIDSAIKKLEDINNFNINIIMDYITQKSIEEKKVKG